MTWIFWVAGALLVALFIMTGVFCIGFGYSKGYDDAMYDIRQVLKEGKAVWESGSRMHRN